VKVEKKVTCMWIFPVARHLFVALFGSHFELYSGSGLMTSSGGRSGLRTEEDRRVDKQPGTRLPSVCQWRSVPAPSSWQLLGEERGTSV